MEEKHFDRVDSDWNYLSWVTQAVVMYCICAEQRRLSDAADRAQERQMVTFCWNNANFSALRQGFDRQIIQQYRSIILAAPFLTWCAVWLRHHAQAHGSVVTLAADCYITNTRIWCLFWPVLFSLNVLIYWNNWFFLTVIIQVQSEMTVRSAY